MISQIRIQNFRSLVDVTVNLEPLTVLIGRSGTGKSNFVDALRFLRDSLNSRQVNLGQSGEPRVMHVDHLMDPLRYTVFFSISAESASFEYILYANAVTGVILDESLAKSGNVLFNHSHGKWVRPPDVIPTPPPNGIMLGSIAGLLESTHAHHALRSGIGCYNFPSEVLMTDGHRGEPNDRGFADRGENYLLAADRIVSDLSKARNWARIAKRMQAVNRAASTLTVNAPVPDRLDVGFQLNGRIATLDVRHESEGFRRFLAHLLALYQNPSKQTLLFEHPETGLHPGALESLSQEFRNCPEDGRGQVILTTHSPQLLDYFPPESLRVVDIEKLETSIGPVAPEQMESLREHLLLPGELLTVDPARLAGQLAEVPEGNVSYCSSRALATWPPRLHWSASCWHNYPNISRDNCLWTTRP